MSESAVRLYVFPLPPDELRPNVRIGGHWGPLNKVRQQYALACCLLIQQVAVPSCLTHCEMHVTAYLGKRQRCDPPDVGAWAKVAIDALVTTDVIADDNNACIRLFSARVSGGERDNPRLEILVREVLQ